LGGRGEILARFFLDIWDQATQLHLERKYDEAESLYDQLLTQNPDNPGLLATLGTLYIQKKKVGLAICLLEAALKKGMRQSDVLSNLGLAYKFSGQMEKAKKYFEESIKDSPSGEALANYSALFIESGQDEKCKSICKRAIDLSPEHPIAHWNLALALLAEGKWDQAWDEHEWGLVNNCMRKDRDLGGVPVWDGTPGKRVAVYGEQGIGDEIMFASMLPDLLKTNEVVLESHTRLKTLFEKSFPSVKVYGMREEKIPTWVENESFDYRISIGSLGKFYRRSRDAFPGTPYLTAEALPKGEKFRVGISWTGGGAKQGRVQKRSVPLAGWKSILNVPNVEFVSLQYTDGQEEIDLQNALGYKIKVMDEYVKAEDYYETARLVKSCDLVISVCTTVIHLAGALGVPCWVMTPKFPAWRYQNTGGMPWYRSVRLYRQPEPKQDAWRPVVERIGLDLDELVNPSKLAA
jgi:hypothetical protein